MEEVFREAELMICKYGKEGAVNRCIEIMDNEREEIESLSYYDPDAIDTSYHRIGFFKAVMDRINDQMTKVKVKQ